MFDKAKAAKEAKLEKKRIADAEAPAIIRLKPRELKRKNKLPKPNN